MVESSVNICPVPEEQQPINEYQELKESWFFSWATLELFGYIRKLLWVWGLSLFVSVPVAAASFAPQKYLVQFILCASAGAGVFLVLILLRLYLGWSYIRSRLLEETIFYEESGWYDGQTWTKPPEISARDRLIVSYQIQPILQRLKRTFAILVLFVVGGGLIWNFL
ncbi:MAG: CGLD27 family protein [Symploca sp. SIO1B1]|nr:CGLD27 family protein [Symploca sp. SIO1A3]NER94490.1 CGLD27 family protein [Symploca sp. SIO1B1]